MADPLDFTPLPGIVCETTGDSLVWHAQRGAFVYTIILQPAVAEYGISVSFSPACLPDGPFRSLDEAKLACAKAMMLLGN